MDRDAPDDERLELEARRQGTSDGRHGYPFDPGDWKGRHRAAYAQAYAAAASHVRRATRN